MKASQLTFLRIGSRSSTFKRLGVGDKPRLLNEVFKGGLPVPAAIVLLDEGWKRMIADGIVEIDGENVIVHSADEFMARFALNGVRANVAVRSAVGAHAKLNVPPATVPLIEAVVAIWQSATDDRRDILIMEMVEPQQQGTVISCQEAEFDVVTESLQLPKLARWQRSTQTVDWQRRLQMLLRGVRRTLSLEKEQDWKISWVDDGKTCWVVGIRPISPSNPS